MNAAPPQTPLQGRGGQLKDSLFLESALAFLALWLISKTNLFDRLYELGNDRVSR